MSEYTLIGEQEIRHFKNGLLRAVWKLENGNLSGEYELYNNGCVLYHQASCKANSNIIIRKINKSSGQIRELVDCNTQRVIYRGAIDSEGKRTGQGIEFDVESGEKRLEGIWFHDELLRIIHVFYGKQMIELRKNRKNTDLIFQVPIYVGEYYYNETTNTCYRHGIGYLLSSDGSAYKKGEWENGIEKSTTTLINGWYKVEEDCLKYSLNIEDIVVPDYKFEYEHYLNFNKYKSVKTINIKGNNFSNADHFILNDLETLETVEIDHDCFYRDDRRDRMNRTFSILNCNHLRSLKIGAFSFFYFSGGFELTGLPSLELIQIGEKDEDSFSFSRCNFVIRGMLLDNVSMNRLAQIENNNIGKSCL